MKLKTKTITYFYWRLVTFKFLEEIFPLFWNTCSTFSFFFSFTSSMVFLGKQGNPLTIFGNTIFSLFSLCTALPFLKKNRAPSVQSTFCGLTCLFTLERHFRVLIRSARPSCCILWTPFALRTSWPENTHFPWVTIFTEGSGKKIKNVKGENSSKDENLKNRTIFLMGSMAIFQQAEFNVRLGMVWSIRSLEKTCVNLESKFLQWCR